MREVPRGWTQITLKDLAHEGEFFDGDWVESKDQDPSGTVRLLQLADVGEGEFRDRSNRWLREDQARKLGASFLEVGDLLIARMPHPMGRCCQVFQLSTKTITAVDVAVLRVRRPDVNPRYAMWAINSPVVRSEIASFSSGTTRQRVSRKNLGKVDIPLAPVHEQTRIVEILEEQFSRLESAFASTRLLRAKAESFCSSLLHTAFSGGLTSGTEGWREVMLGDVCEYVRGVTYSKSEASEESIDGFIPLLRATNIAKSRILLSDFVHVPEARVKPVQMLRRGDLVMAASSGSTKVVGKCGLVPEGFYGTFGAFCAVLRSFDGLDHRYLNYLVASPTVREGWSAAARGTNINNLKREDVLRTLIPLPPLSEQEHIVDILAEQFSRLDSALAIAGHLEGRIASQRRSLLHAAFAGELTAEWRDAHV